MAESDAHLLFSPNPAPTSLEPVYEIIIGGGKNTFSEIRRLRRSNSRATITTKDILSPEEMRIFWVGISIDSDSQL